MSTVVDREDLGKLVRKIWIEWANEQPDPKPSWLLPWEDLSEPDREVDRRIGERLFREGQKVGLDTEFKIITFSSARGGDVSQVDSIRHGENLAGVNVAAVLAGNLCSDDCDWCEGLRKRCLSRRTF